MICLGSFVPTLRAVPDNGRCERRGLQDGLEAFVGGAWIGRGYEIDELAGAEGRAGLVGGRLHVGHVGLALRSQRGGDADENGVGLAEAGKVRGRGEATGGYCSGDAAAVEVLDVALATVELGDLVGIHVETEDGKALLDEGESQREADVTHADDADEGVVGLDLGEEAVSVGGSHGWGSVVSHPSWDAMLVPGDPLFPSLRSGQAHAPAVIHPPGGLEPAATALRPRQPLARRHGDNGRTAGPAATGRRLSDILHPIGEVTAGGGGR